MDIMHVKHLICKDALKNGNILKYWLSPLHSKRIDLWKGKISWMSLLHQGLHLVPNPRINAENCQKHSDKIENIQMLEIKIV